MTGAEAFTVVAFVAVALHPGFRSQAVSELPWQLFHIYCQLFRVVHVELLWPPRFLLARSPQKVSALRFSHAGILRGTFGSEDYCVSSTNTKLCEVSAGMSERSALAHQVLVMDAILVAQDRHISVSLAPSPMVSDILVVKRIWDEASIILRLSRDILRTLLGCVTDEFLARDPPPGKLERKPSYLAQTFQQVIYVRWGMQKLSADKVVVPAMVLGRGTTAFLMTGLADSVPQSLSIEHLDLVANTRLWAIFYCIPDNLAANKLCSHDIGMRSKHLLVWESGCFAHGLSLTINHGLNAESLVDRQYGLVALCTQAGNAVHFFESSLLRFRELRVHQGIAPPNGHSSAARLTDLVLKYTVLRERLVQSWIPHAAASLAFEKNFTASLALSEKNKLFYSGNWANPIPEHFWL